VTPTVQDYLGAAQQSAEADEDDLVPEEEHQALNTLNESV